MDKNNELIKLGITNTGKIYNNLGVMELFEIALKIRDGDAILSNSGALCVWTGKYTGRSPDDRYFVDTEDVHNKIEWDESNLPISEEKYNNIYNKVTAYLQGKNLFIFDGFVGADKDYRMPIRVISENPDSAILSDRMLIVPDKEELKNIKPTFTLIATPNFRTIPEIDGVNSEAAIIINFKTRMILVIASRYGGEIKKAIFTTMNYLMPEKKVLPMHCSANIGKDGKTALFFGLSGTGKTTLSADPNRKLIGDDEHGWSNKGIFNFEGGCYAKCIRLSKENEPQIWNAVKAGAIVENVVLDVNRVPDYNDAEYTENTRVAYPIEFIPNAELSGIGNHPNAIIFLTADAFGVLPPISRLTKEQAMYYFISGYTSKLAGTERGITEPLATFSTCFGAPFMPRPSVVYGKMLKENMVKYNTRVYLLNTGWSGGPYGIGKRIDLPYSRAMVTAALNGELDGIDFYKESYFNLMIPKKCSGVPDELLNPISTWDDKEEYDRLAKELANKFNDNIKKFKGIEEDVLKSGPSLF
ncbi:phosphoenolpyruvate carboxykinase (ATP) [candidate division TA06 bacterium]|uniref:Phosphoenolpyruvate carboxykinase (ATP) n=1 Tax=candidate division TA06 bacterium TaxID=2250710 RepID=A0A660SNZ3_UNCT6|nr:MAG: phosphoenolpyruvate carboxykinase (ATP) [candidate division TA06 bacterium]